MTMHEGQLDIDLPTVRRLVARDFPEWSALDIVPVRSSGTVNAIYRVGPAHAVRLPLMPAPADAARASLESEAAALEAFRRVCPFDAPQPAGFGGPGYGYPLPWSAQTWVDGDVAGPTDLADSADLAHDLATLLTALRSADRGGRVFDRPGRGGDLTTHDAWVTRCCEENARWFSPATTSALWSALRVLPRATDVMTHGDLIPANLLVRSGRLAGVLDGGGYGPADPALDLVAAWHLLDAEPRQDLRERLGCSDVEWQRGAAWAFVQAGGLVWYYARTNPVMHGLGVSTLRRLIDDEDLRTFTGRSPAY